MPSKRTAYTHQEKIAIREHHAQQPLPSQRHLWTWFEESLGKPIRQNRISEILSSRYSHLDKVLTPLNSR
jgi:hypothetical protein